MINISGCKITAIFATRLENKGLYNQICDNAKCKPLAISGLHFCCLNFCITLILICINDQISMIRCSNESLSTMERFFTRVL